jgi:hypothetical protein
MTWSARRMVSSSCSTTSSVLPLIAQRLEGVEQHAVVARVQADGGLVEDVAHAAQVGAELRGERMRCASPPDSVGAARSSAGSRARPPAGSRAGADLGDQVAGDLGLAPAELQPVEEAPRPLRPTAPSVVGDAALAKAHRQRLGVEARAVAARAGLLVDGSHLAQSSLPGLLAGWILVEAPAAARRCRSSSHQPCLELYENSRGSSSGKLVPQDGQARLVEKVTGTRRPASTLTTPLPCSSACRARAARLVVGRRPRPCPTGRSMVCSL